MLNPVLLSVRNRGINRPITRSFGAQLLKKAQANGGAAPAPPAAAQKPVARKPVLKPAPRPEQVAKASDENKKVAAAGSAHKVPRKKVVNTLTAVLSHRSKVSPIDPTPTSVLYCCFFPLYGTNSVL